MITEIRYLTIVMPMAEHRHTGSSYEQYACKQEASVYNLYEQYACKQEASVYNLHEQYACKQEDSVYNSQL